MGILTLNVLTRHFLTVRCVDVHCMRGTLQPNDEILVHNFGRNLLEDVSDARLRIPYRLGVSSLLVYKIDLSSQRGRTGQVKQTLDEPTSTGAYSSRLETLRGSTTAAGWILHCFSRALSLKNPARLRLNSEHRPRAW